jgi:hypothetical protein
MLKCFKVLDLNDQVRVHALLQTTDLDRTVTPQSHDRCARFSHP